MSAESEKTKSAQNLVCPTCKSDLKKRRTRKPDDCEMICGGCGEIFDVCDLKTVEKLNRSAE